VPPAEPDGEHPRLPRPLDAVEVRVIGSLLEKQQATPEYYPLTRSALVAACNQKSDREPVMELADDVVLYALERLRQHVLVWQVGGGRADRWEENITARWGLDPRAKAVLTLLLLRGPQTPGELRSRSDRLHAFSSLEEIGEVLGRLARGAEPLVAELPRQPGQKEGRFTHLVSGPPAEGAHATAAAPVSRPSPAFEERLGKLEALVDALAAELGALKRRLGEGD
jgi:uncharacterized protein YceH (UPF0502 family)